MFSLTPLIPQSSHTIYDNPGKKPVVQFSARNRSPPIKTQNTANNNNHNNNDAQLTHSEIQK